MSFKKQYKTDESQTLFDARLELDRRLYKVEDARWVKLYLDEHSRVIDRLNDIGVIREMITNNRFIEALQYIDNILRI